MLKGEKKDDSIRILESCGFNVHIGLRVLEQKSLITISDSEGLRFHDHIEEMCWNIVRGLHPLEPSKHSRLRIKEEIEDILVNELGTDVTRSIKLKYTSLHPTTIMRGLRKMRKLRFLSVQSQYWNKGDIVRAVDEVSQYLPDALQSLYWPMYPFRSLPQTFQANKLVNLEMFMSNISELWEGGEKKVLNKIRFIDLRYSKLETFDLSMTPILKKLNLEGCCDLFKLHIPVECPKLKFLKLGGSKVSILNLGMTPHLEELNLSGCNKFVELHMPIECRKLKFLNLGGSKVSILNLGMTPHLEELNLSGCNKFVELHMPIECPKLKFLNLKGSKVSILNLGMTPHLKELDLEGCYYLQEIHAPMGCLKNLVYFNFNGCSRFKRFAVYKKNEVHDVVRLSLFAESLDRCPLHPESNLPKFQFYCNYWEPLPSSSGNIEKLISFGLCACTNLESFSTSICGLQHLRELTLIGSIPEVPNDLYQLQSLEMLRLWMKEIKHLPDNICMLKRLKSLDLNDCRSLQVIPNSICKMECLNKLNIGGAGIRHLPYNIFQWKGLCITGTRGQLESCGFTNLIFGLEGWYVRLNI
ncbi:putative leucine-rich repeat domain superfamily [Helianthus debilis subsp. tardiflorus]